MPEIDDMDLNEEEFPHGSQKRQEEVARVNLASQPTATEAAANRDRLAAEAKAAKEQEEQDQRDYAEWKKNRGNQVTSGSDVPKEVWAGGSGS